MTKGKEKLCKIVHVRPNWFRLDDEQADCRFVENVEDYAEKRRQTGCLQTDESGREAISLAGNTALAVSWLMGDYMNNDNLKRESPVWSIWLCVVRWPKDGAPDCNLQRTEMLPLFGRRRTKQWYTPYQRPVLCVPIVGTTASHANLPDKETPVMEQTTSMAGSRVDQWHRHSFSTLTWKTKKTTMKNGL